MRSARLLGEREQGAHRESRQQGGPGGPGPPLPQAEVERQQGETGSRVSARKTLGARLVRRPLAKQ